MVLCTLLFFCAFFVALTGPVFVFTYDFFDVMSDPWSEEHLAPALIFWYSIIFYFSLFVGLFYLAARKSSSLNRLLRYAIMFFNTTYPFTSVVGLFWLVVPPYTAIRALFPFNLDAFVAVVGTICIKIIEFGVVSRLQSISNLEEYAIANVQRLDKVTYPIKMRAIIKGISTSFNDRYYKHDNSWCTSFGGSAAIAWVRRWLVLLMATGLMTVLAAITNMILQSLEGTLVTTFIPLGFALIAGLNQILLVWEPLLFVWRGDNVLDIAPRFIELFVMLAVLIAVVVMLELAANQGQLAIPGYS